MELKFTKLTQVVALSCALLTSSGSLLAAEPSSKAPNQITWDLTDLYQSQDAWNLQRKELIERVAKVKALSGTLAQNASSLADALDEISSLSKEVVRLYVYANLSSDTDLRNAEVRELLSLAAALYSDFQANTSFVNPELLKAGEDKILQYIHQEERLKKHSVFLKKCPQRSTSCSGRRG